MVRMEQDWRFYVLRNAWLWYLLAMPAVLPGFYLVSVYYEYDDDIQGESAWLFVAVWSHIFVCLLGYQYWLDMSREAKNALMAHDETVELA
jgi:hypothetical protein